MLSKIFKNKKGGEKLLSIWWVFIISFVALIIAIGVDMFYGSEVDVREIEADILYEKVIECVVEQGFLVEDINSMDDQH